MRRLPFKELHDALYTRITTDAATLAYSTYPASGVPLNAAFPYVTIQLVHADRMDSKNTITSNVRLVIKGHTRTAIGVGDDADAYAIANNVMKAVTRSKLSLSNNHTTILQLAEPSAPLSYENDGFMYRECEVEFRTLIQDMGE